MKRINLTAEITHKLYKNKDNYYKGIKNIVKFIQNNYRRRKYNKKTYVCTNCLAILNAGKICKCERKNNG